MTQGGYKSGVLLLSTFSPCFIPLSSLHDDERGSTRNDGTYMYCTM